MQTYCAGYSMSAFLNKLIRDRQNGSVVSAGATTHNAHTLCLSITHAISHTSIDSGPSTGLEPPNLMLKPAATLETTQGQIEGFFSQV